MPEPKPSRAEEEAELMRQMVRYQAGELGGFEALYGALAADLERFFAACDSAQNSADLVQETFLELHRARHTYEHPRPVRPWVFGVARHVLRRHRRATWRRARREHASSAEARLTVRPVPSSAEAADAWHAVQALPEGRRRVWVLHHLHGWTFREIAARLGIGKNAAKLRSSRAARSLREALSGEGEGDGG